MAKKEILPEWILFDLYSGIKDPALKKDRSLVYSEVEEFTKKYKGRINSGSLSAQFLRNAICELEKLEEMLFVYVSYASLIYSTNTNDPKIGAFYQEALEFSNKVTTSLLWFLLEIQALPNEQFMSLASEKSLTPYRHYLEKVYKFAPYRKSLKEEEIIAKFSLTSEDAYKKFYDEHSSSLLFEFKGKSLTYPEISKIMRDDPNVMNRKSAGKSYTKVFNNNKQVYKFLLNSLLLNKKTTDEIRGYKTPEEATLLEYEIDSKVLSNLTNTVQNNYKLSERYYSLKSKLVGRKLYEWDRYSKIYDIEKASEIPFTEAKNIILSSFKKFDDTFYRIAKMFFDDGLVDAKVYPGKRSGAFCSYIAPSRYPRILVNYTGTTNDIMTLAHELGHGIHAYLSRDNSLYNYYPSTAVAEIASVFAESLVFDNLYTKENNLKIKINLLADKIQGNIATIFRQNAFYNFEKKIHEHRRNIGELSVEDFSRYFQIELNKMFGRGLTLTNDHSLWWMPVLHFYHYNFYVFTYAFGEALSISLYENYRSNPNRFKPGYISALKKGGSASPERIAIQMGADISQPDFWQNGMNLIGKYIDEFEDLAKTLR